MFALVNAIMLISILFFELYLEHEEPLLLGICYYWVTFLPAWGATVRRLHDTGNSGWWILLSLISLIGAFFLIILSLISLIGAFFLLIIMAEPGHPEENKYGPNPYAVTPDETVAQET